MRHFQGLTAEEVEKRQAEGKINALPDGSENSVSAIFRRHVFTLFNLVNLILAGLLLSVGSYRNMLFCGVVISNAVIGVVNELRAKREHDRLALLNEGKIRTLRDGVEKPLSPGELVLDDVVLLSRGDQAPADMQILDGSCEADESMLTGESVPVRKEVGETVFSGSHLVSGGITARLTAVGADSYAGQLQIKARKVKRSTSRLMEDMRRLIRVITILLLPIGLLLYWRQTRLPEATTTSAITATVGAMIGMIPEGLLLLTSVSLTAGVIKLARRNALVNELYGIESLARVDVLCMDKTGTLTSGNMVFQEAVPFGDISRDQLMEELSLILRGVKEDGPTASALSVACTGVVAEEPLSVMAFSSERKWSAAVYEKAGTLLLGAPEKLLRGAELKRAQDYAAEGYRVLALLRGETPLNGETLPEGLTPQGIFCLRDTLRPHVEETLRYFSEEGVSIRVLSGDSALTVSKTALQAGVPGAEACVDMSQLSEKDYDALCREYTIFGRVSPEDKRGLIEALKAQGHSTAMIGDGVNDIPALKAADCSIALKGGSEAACRVAQITLQDGDFNILPQILLEGRRVINNICRASSLFLIKNMFSLFLSLALLFLPYAYPFQPIQLTLISTLTIGAPSFILALQPNRDRVQGNFLRNMLRRALPGGICTSLLVLGLMIASSALNLSEGAERTMATFAAGYSGFVALTLICLPLNPLRLAVVLVMAGAFAGAALLFPQLFYLVPLAAQEWKILLWAIPLAPLAQVGLGRLMTRLHFGGKRGK